MPEDASLDDFLDGGSGDVESDDAESGDVESDGRASSPSESEPAAASTDDAVETEGALDDASATGDDPEPATTTFHYDPEGGACAACGECVTERWHDDGELVCGSCKEW